MPGIVAGIILVFVPSLGQFVVSDLLGGAKTILAGNLIQNQFAVARNKPFGAAIAFELTAAVLLLLLRLRALHEAQGRRPAVSARDVLPVNARSAAGRPPLAGSWERCCSPHAWLVYLFLYAPIVDPRALLVQPRRSRPRSGRASRSTGTASLLAQRAHPARGQEQPDRGACATTVVATVVGTLAALALGRVRVPRQGADAEPRSTCRSSSRRS